MLRVVLTVVLTTFLAVGLVLPALGQVQPKKRVAVFDFDNATVQTQVAIPFFQQTSNTGVLGKAVADLLVTRLVQDSACSVIERKALDKLLEEQNLSNSNRTDPLTAAKLGRVLGVDAIILGSITHYDRETKVKGGGGSALAPLGIGRGGGMTSKQDLRGVVQISARVVSPDTAEVLAVAQASGESLRKGVKTNMMDASVYMGGNTNDGGLMAEAMDKAVALLAPQLEQNLVKLPPRVALVDGLVADTNAAGRLILNVGGRLGVKIGDRLQVWRSGKPVRDPATGKVLRFDDSLIGEAVVTSVDDVSAEAAYTGTEPGKAGDRVKGLPKQI